MELTTSLLLYTALLVIVGAFRLGELRLSRHNRNRLRARGAARVPEPHFRAMVLLHTAILAGSGLEAWLTRRPPILPLTAAMLGLLVGATALRLWVIATLGRHWNVVIVDSVALGVVTRGPYRWIRHPNYVAVFVELLALPLVHAAWVTALLGSAAHVWVLYHRIRTEEAALLAHQSYRALMGPKPRFIPRLGLAPPGGGG